MLGSIKFAVPLLTAIAAILIWATFYESEVGSQLVQQTVYKSSWFGALMFLLALNLGLSALSRYPWRGVRKVGFALTHLGLIVIIAGSAAVIHLSVEGMLLVRTDQGANSLVRMQGELLEVINPQQESYQAELTVHDDGRVYPKQLGNLQLISYTPNATQTVAFKEGGDTANPAIHLALHSDRMGQDVTNWLALAPAGYGRMEIGPATLELVQAQTKAELDTLLAAPTVNAGPVDSAAATVAQTSSIQNAGLQQPQLQAKSTTPTGVRPLFRVVVAPNGELWYAAAASQSFSSGPLEVGEPVSTGWADFQVMVDRYLTHALISRTVVPAPETAAKGQPALEIATPDGHHEWLMWGSPATLTDANGDYLASFSPQMLRLPFAVQLQDFIVERNEGSMSVAMWTSQVQIQDAHAGVLAERRVWMNHPTWYRGWKLAQASWNPGDLKQSTLQVKREPWWVTALTWLGSLLVVLGVGVMFYGGAVLRQLRRWWPQAANPASSKADATVATVAEPVVEQSMTGSVLTEPTPESV
ncbi:MAG: cytochrome c biogenesis protein ResB [Cyanobacteria bacterium P01_H01_bin.121]